MKNKYNKIKYNLWIIFFRIVRTTTNSLEYPFSLFTNGKNKHILAVNRISKVLFKNKNQLLFENENDLVEIDILTNENEKISLVSFIPNPNSKKWVIMCHWFTGHKYWMLMYSKQFTALGYNVLSFDFRNHGTSEKNKKMTMGIEESKDLEFVIKYLSSNFECDSIGLYGISMGSFVVNATNCMNLTKEETKKIKWGICGSGYKSLNSLFQHLLSFKMIPFKKKRISQIISFIFKNQLKLSKDIIDDFEQKMNNTFINCSFPTRYVHTMSDRTTCPFDSLDFYLKRKVPNDELTIFKKGTHGLIMRNNFDLLFYQNMKFVSKIENLSNEQFSKIVSDIKISFNDKETKKILLDLKRNLIE